MTSTSPQTITRLHVTGFKRLTSVEVVPEAETPTVIISGENSAGKTSVLDALETVLTGVDRKRTPRPVHEGAGMARIVAETQDYIITRTFTEKEDGKTSSTLLLVGRDGGRYASPQTLLDGMFGDVAVDPGEFLDLPAARQREALLKAVDLPFNLDALEAERATAYAERTDANRRVRELDAQYQGAVDHLPEEDAPTEEQTTMEAVTNLDGLRQDRRRHLAATQRVEAADLDVAQLEEKLALAREEQAEARDQLAATPEVLDAELSGALARLEGLDAYNRQARENAAAWAAHQELEDALHTATEAAEALDYRVKALDAQKARGLAEAAFPLEGLGFTPEGITYLGQPFEQASTAERIRVSFAVATAKPGRVRVVLIRRGESLDRKSLDQVAALAAEAGFQVWVEKVSETRELGVWHMEDGQLAQ